MLGVVAIFILFLAFAGWLIWSNISASEDDRFQHELEVREAEKDRVHLTNVAFRMPKPGARGVDQWVLNPGMKLKFMINGIRNDGIEQLHSILSDKSFLINKKAKEDVLKILVNNAVDMPDFEQFLQQQREFYRNEFDIRIANTPDWNSLNEYQRKEKAKQFLSEINQQAELTPCIPVHRLLEGSYAHSLYSDSSQSNVTINKQMGKRFVRQYGLDVLKYYLSLKNPGVPIIADKDVQERTILDKMHDLGLAKKGKEIDAEEYLQHQSLEVLSELAVTNNGVFNSKQDAITYIKDDIICMENVNKKIPFRFLYLPKRLEAIDDGYSAAQLEDFLIHYDLLNELFLTTYHHMVMAQMLLTDENMKNPRYRFFIQRDDSRCSNICNKAKEFQGRPFIRKHLPELPIHIGCNCVYDQVHVDELNERN